MAHTVSFSENDWLVPLTKRKSVKNFACLLSLAREHNLGDEARHDLEFQGEGIVGKVKPILSKHATSRDGIFQVTWNNLHITSRSKIVKEMHHVAPWLMHFEHTWAAEWIGKHMLNQRVYDRRRPVTQNRERERDRRRVESDLAEGDNFHSQLDSGQGKLCCYII
jgi:hypothetical protein